MDQPPGSLKARVNALFEPAQILSLAAYHLAAVVLHVIFVRRDVTALLHPSQIRQEAFSKFWLACSPPDEEPKELSGSAALIPALLSQARGHVLEIGPGSGSTFRFYGPAVGAMDSLYVAEPVKALHRSLHAKASALGLRDVFTILPCSAEKESILPAIANAGLLQRAVAEDGLFDTIVCIRVLCGVSHPADTLDNLYKLLRPGGQFLIAEHVRNPWTSAAGSLAGRLFQWLYSCVGWEFFVGCSMTRDTSEILVSVGQKEGGWEHIDLKACLGWTSLPYVSGRLQKRRISN